MEKSLPVAADATTMKAVVLAGGYATRLWPITKDRPKMFLPVGDTVIVDQTFEALEADDRISEVYVSTNERFADAFRDHLDDRPYEKPTLTVEDTSAEDEKFGVVGALAQLVEREGVEEDLLVIAGDNVIGFELSDFLDFFEERGTPTLAAYDVGAPERAKPYSAVELDGDRVVSFQEKPDDPQTSLISIACYAFTAETLSPLGEYLANDNNPDEPGWFLQWLQNRESVHAYAFDGAWFDIGTPESYLEAVAWELDGDAVVADDATVENTTLGENVHVMSGAELVDASVDRSVVFPDATVRDCDVRDSLVDEEAHLENIDFSDAVVGAHTRISNGD
jgi:glucose-1-phosphate thymidylyltransferase